MKKTLLLGLAFGLLAGCQSYPANPSKPSFLSSYVNVNKNIPSELNGVSFTLVKHSNADLENSVDKESK